MEELQIEQLLDLLLQATSARKLQWKPYHVVGNKGYCTCIDNCRVCLGSGFSAEDNDFINVVQLHNVNDDVFYRGEFDDNDNPIYEPLNRLILLIEKQYLMIEESWERINQGLQRLVNE